MGLEYEKARRQKKASSNPQGKNVKKVMTHAPVPPSESQLELIATLKKKLEDNGHNTSFIVEPVSRNMAKHVCNALIRMCKKHGLSKERDNA